MNKKIFITTAIIITLLFICVVIILSLKSSSLPPPDKIIVHTSGRSIEIDKKNKSYEKIVGLTNKRLTSSLEVAKTIIDTEFIEESKYMSVEFLYNKTNKFYFTGIWIIPRSIEFDMLYFPLKTDPKSINSPYYETETFAMIYGHKGTYKSGPLYKLNTPNELVKYIESFIK